MKLTHIPAILLFLLYICFLGHWAWLEENYQHELGLVYKKNKVLSPTMKKFIGLLKEVPSSRL
jgi:hypothetical protein